MSTANRDNGLYAPRYTPLVDLEPHFADALLDALREEGVAAYASPSPGVRGPYMDTQLPNSLTDRVFVDAASAEAAQRVLQSRRPEFERGEGAPRSSGPAEGEQAPAGLEEEPASTGAELPAEGEATNTTPEADLDAAFRAIVAGYGATGEEPVGRWPVSEDVEDGPTGRGFGLRRGQAEDRGVADGRGTGDQADDNWGLPADHDPAPAQEDVGPGADTEDAEDHYVPPPPPPLPRVDLRTKLAWFAVIGAPILLILFTALDWTPFGGARVLAVAAFIAGFASLVYRMKDDRGGDDGAVV